jgi:hypothetical protein
MLDFERIQPSTLSQVIALCLIFLRKERGYGHYPYSTQRLYVESCVQQHQSLMLPS